MVYEGIMKEGGIMKADISNEIIKLVGHICQAVQKKSKENQTLFVKKCLKRLKVVFTTFLLVCF